MTKVKDILPQTPKKKAVIWKKLIESASTSKVHSGRQGLTLTPACKKKLQVADAMVESVKEGISEVKSSGRKDIEKIQKKRVYQEHALRASWQQKQMGVCVEQLSEGCVSMVMHFSEYYGCVFQCEVQSGFFDRNQITVHPMMCYYK